MDWSKKLEEYHRLVALKHDHYFLVEGSDESYAKLEAKIQTLEDQLLRQLQKGDMQ